MADDVDDTNQEAEQYCGVPCLRHLWHRLLCKWKQADDGSGEPQHPSPALDSYGEKKQEREVLPGTQCIVTSSGDKANDQKLLNLSEQEKDISEQQWDMPKQPQEVTKQQENVSKLEPDVPKQQQEASKDQRDVPKLQQEVQSQKEVPKDFESYQQVSTCVSVTPLDSNTSGRYTNNVSYSEQPVAKYSNHCGNMCTKSNSIPLTRKRDCQSNSLSTTVLKVAPFSNSDDDINASLNNTGTRSSRVVVETYESLINENTGIQCDTPGKQENLDNELPNNDSTFMAVLQR